MGQLGWDNSLPYIKTNREKVETETLKQLENKKVVKVRYLTDQELKDFGWSKSPLVIMFEDGTYIYAQSDDEGNNGGCLSGGNLHDSNVNIYCPSSYPTNKEKK